MDILTQDQAVIRQVLRNLVRAASEWVSISVDPIAVAPHTITNLDVSFTTAGQVAELLTGQIRLDTNDPLHPLVRVPMKFEITPAAPALPSRGGRTGAGSR